MEDQNCGWMFQPGNHHPLTTSQGERKRMRMDFKNVTRLLSMGALLAALTGLAVAQDEPTPPPPPPMGGAQITMHGPGGGFGMVFHEEVGLGDKVVTGAPMTATVTVTHDQTLSDGNTIHTEEQSTEYRDLQGRVRREVPFKLMTPATGATQGTMVIISDPVAGKRYVLNPQKKTAHEMPLRPPRLHPAETAGATPPPGEVFWAKPATNSNAAETIGAAPAPGESNITTQSLGTKTILGLPAQGTEVTRTIPAGAIGNANPIVVTTERWMSTDLQIPLSITHKDPMMGTMTTTVTSLTRGEPDASLFQVPSDYKVEAGHSGDMMYMNAKP
jgi:hypothetical protein